MVVVFSLNLGNRPIKFSGWAQIWPHPHCPLLKLYYLPFGISCCFTSLHMWLDLKGVRQGAHCFGSSPYPILDESTANFHFIYNGTTNSPRCFLSFFLLSNFFPHPSSSPTPLSHPQPSFTVLHVSALYLPLYLTSFLFLEILCPLPPLAFLLTFPDIFFSLLPSSTTKYVLDYLLPLATACNFFLTHISSFYANVVPSSLLPYIFCVKIKNWYILKKIPAFTLNGPLTLLIHHELLFVKSKHSFLLSLFFLGIFGNFSTLRFSVTFSLAFPNTFTLM